MSDVERIRETIIRADLLLRPYALFCHTSVAEELEKEFGKQYKIIGNSSIERGTIYVVNREIERMESMSDFEYLKDLEKAEMERKNGFLCDISPKALRAVIEFVKCPEEHIHKCEDCVYFDDYRDGYGWCTVWNCDVKKQFYCGNFGTE